MSISFKDFLTKHSHQNKTKYCFVDFDGTVREFNSNHAPYSPEEVKVFPWAKARLEEARNKGYVLIGITNQAKATKLLGAEAVRGICDETIRQLGIQFPYIFSQEESQSKPSTYMLKEAEKTYGPADLSASVFVGDDDSKDGEAARAFHIQFIPVQEFKEHGVR
jgi:HAD superfamily hydrolase (TIGR01662 family)